MIESRAKEPSRKYMRMTKTREVEGWKIRKFEHGFLTSSLPLVGISKRKNSAWGDKSSEECMKTLT